MTEKKTPKIEFAPGCFDQFEGTQEELDQMIAEITAAIESGEFMENSRALDMDELLEEDPELAEILMKQLSNIDDSKDRKLN